MPIIQTYLNVNIRSRFDVNRLRVLVGEKTIIGAIIMGDQMLSQPLHHLITRRVDITPIRDRLLQPDTPLGDIIAAFWTQRIKTNAISTR